MYKAEIIKISNGYYVNCKIFEQTRERKYFKNYKAAELAKKFWESQN